MDEKKMPPIDIIIKRAGGSKDSIIQVLHEVQESLGYLPPEAMDYISKKMGIPLSTIYGIITFYNYFKTEKDAEHVILVCMGTACYVKGSDKILKALENLLGIKAGETTKDGKFSLRMVRCLGACGMAPVISVDGTDAYGRLTPESVADVIKKYQ